MATPRSFLLVFSVSTLCSIGVVSGQDGKPTVRKTEHAADDFFPKHRRETTYVGNQAHGTCRGYGAENRLLFEQEFVDGSVHGEQICYYPSGKKYCSGRFEKGKLEGEQKFFFPDGKTVAGIDPFKKGVMEGIQTVFYPNGRKMVVTPYVNGKPHGEQIHYTAGTDVFEGQGYKTVTFVDGKKTKESIDKLVSVSATDLAQAKERQAFSALLKDHWKTPFAKLGPSADYHAAARIFRDPKSSEGDRITAVGLVTRSGNDPSQNARMAEFAREIMEVEIRQAFIAAYAKGGVNEYKRKRIVDAFGEDEACPAMARPQIERIKDGKAPLFQKENAARSLDFIGPKAGPEAKAAIIEYINYVEKAPAVEASTRAKMLQKARKTLEKFKDVPLPKK